MTTATREERLRAAIRPWVVDEGPDLPPAPHEEKLAEDILAAVLAALGEEDRPCCTEYGVFQDRRSDGCGFSFQETYAGLDAARFHAAVMAREHRYPTEVRRRAVTHGLWAAVPTAPRTPDPCEPACVFQDEDHDQCAREHDECNGNGCDGCHNGLMWVVP